MPRMIFLNLPVADLPAAMRFCEALGAETVPRFTDATAACMAFSDTIHVMLLTHAKFREFTPLPVADPRAAAGALIALSADSRDAVDAAVAAGVAAGGQADPGPKLDYGFMYGRSVRDPEGHHWEVMWMDPAMAEGGCPAAADATAA
jgi:uncharacterized protein